MNQDLRQSILERDGHECQLSQLFGIAHLTRNPCSQDLEVHHVTYKRSPNESPSDLITVCQRCHEGLTDLIRRLRYEAEEPILTRDHICKVPPITGKEYNHEVSDFQDHRRITPTLA